MAPGHARAVRARQGVALAEVLAPPTVDRTWKPVNLSVIQRHDLIDVWLAIFEDVYVHYTQKRALYGFDPLRALMALRRQIPYLDSAAFLRELTLVPTRIRQFRVDRAPDDDRRWLHDVLRREYGRMGCGVEETKDGAFALKW